VATRAFTGVFISILAHTFRSNSLFPLLSGRPGGRNPNSQNPDSKKYVGQ
jgi:hypothetical protein